YRRCWEPSRTSNISICPATNFQGFGTKRNNTGPHRHLVPIEVRLHQSYLLFFACWRVRTRGCRATLGSIRLLGWSMADSQLFGSTSQLFMVKARASLRGLSRSFSLARRKSARPVCAKAFEKGGPVRPMTYPKRGQSTSTWRIFSSMVKRFGSSTARDR
ncbi:unnamed protein product, partial [Scytosiphon promiscuus]